MILLNPRFETQVTLFPSYFLKKFSNYFIIAWYFCQKVLNNSFIYETFWDIKVSFLHWRFILDVLFNYRYLVSSQTCITISLLFSITVLGSFSSLVCSLETKNVDYHGPAMTKWPYLGNLATELCLIFMSPVLHMYISRFIYLQKISVRNFLSPCHGWERKESNTRRITLRACLCWLQIYG